MAKETKDSRTIEILKKVQAGKDEKFESLTVLDAESIDPVPRISTGILSLNIALGGGYPQGRIIEVFGSEGSGKTTACLHGIADVQAKGGVAAFIDVEHALELDYAKRIGVDPSKLLFSQADSGEEALGIVEAVCTNMQAGDLVVVDSVASLVPQIELDGEMGQVHVGLQARLMSQAMRKLTGVISTNGVVVIFINQIRMKIGGYNNLETTSGGRALKFYASQRVEVKSCGHIKRGEEIVGQNVRFKIAKNKVSPPFREAEIELYFGHGFSHFSDLVNVASTFLKPAVIDKTGSWYSFEGERIGQGSDKVVAFLKANPKIADKIRAKVLERIAHAGI